MTCPYQSQLEHLTRLALIPGWKSYAWARAKELESDATGMWAGISTALHKSVVQAQTKPHRATKKSASH